MSTTGICSAKIKPLEIDIFCTSKIFNWASIQLLLLFFKEFQLMAFAFDDNFLSSNQDTNRFLVLARIEPQISFSTIRDFTNLTNGLIGSLKKKRE